MKTALIPCGAPLTIACNINIFNAAERIRYNQLAARVRAALTHRNEIPEGFVFELSDTGITPLEIEEWISMERSCCTFLSIQLSSSATTLRSLTMTGPSGVKQLILSEFPIY